MIQKKIPKERIHVTILGAGKVGAQLAQQFSKKGILIDHIWNRTPQNAQILCEKLGIEQAKTIEQLKKSNSDIYIIAVRDSAIQDVAAELKKVHQSGLVVHTSGATPVGLLSPYFKHVGGFYPLMTFTEGAKIKWTQVPVCINATEPADLHLLSQLAKAIGCKSHILEDNQRATLHTAAVFANNFTNHLVGISFDLLREIHLPTQLLQSLLAETAANWRTHNPYQVQTGPAIRNDLPTIHKHIDVLIEHFEWKEIYEKITASIQKTARKRSESLDDTF